MTRSLSLGIALSACLLTGAGTLRLRADDAKTAPTAPLTAGTTAPDFSLPDKDNKTYKLSDYKGKTVVLAFYPADMTQGCTVEAHNLTKIWPDLQKRGVQLFGVSVQDVNSKKQFCDKEGITYTLLADTNKTTSRDYGVLSARGVANRVTFVIGPDGKVAVVDPHVKPATSDTDLVKMLDKAEKKDAAGK